MKRKLPVGLATKRLFGCDAGKDGQNDAATQHKNRLSTGKSGSPDYQGGGCPGYPIKEIEMKG